MTDTVAKKKRKKRDPNKPKETNQEKALRVRDFRFKPGQCGNPKGRPRKKPITDRYMEALEVALPDEVRKVLGLGKGSVMGDAIARKMAIRAVQGAKAVEAAREMREAIEGKAPQAIKLESEGEVVVRVKYDDHGQHPDNTNS